MEEIVSLILQGCELAKDLELKLPDLAKQPSTLFYSCEEIIKAFGSAKEKFYNDQNLVVRQQHNVSDATLLEWPMTSSNCYYPSLVLDFQPQILGETTTSHELVQSSSGTGQVQAMDVSVSIGKSTNPAASSSQQRPRKRKDDGTVLTKKMAAPEVGNTEMPPEDGYAWKKYGQKEILGSKFPRSYYRCTHQRMYSCPAKKQVQRDNEEHNIFIVTYRGNHTCVMSNTVPSAPPDHHHLHHQIRMSQAMNIGPQSSTTLSSGLSWFSKDMISLSGGEESSSKGVVDHDLPVVDIAAAMFNTSVSSSTNSMEFLFPSVDDNYKLGSDKKSG